MHSEWHSTLHMNLKIKHISIWSHCFQYTLSTCQQAFSFSHKIQFIYFPIYLLLEACAHNLRFALPESTTAQASNAARVRSQKAPDFQLFLFMLNRCTYLRFAFLFHSHTENELNLTATLWRSRAHSQRQEIYQTDRSRRSASFRSADFLPSASFSLADFLSLAIGAWSPKWCRRPAKVWQLDARTLWARDATVTSEQSAEFVFRAVVGRLQSFDSLGKVLFVSNRYIIKIRS